MKSPQRIGIIGYGYIGRHIIEQIRAQPDILDLAFINCRDRKHVRDFDDMVFLEDLSKCADCEPDLILEAAHPIITETYGKAFLEVCDYLPLSTSSLIDKAYVDVLQKTALKFSTKLFLPAGALIGGEEFIKRTIPWQRVRITFRKNPRNIDFSTSGINVAGLDKSVTVFEGTVTEVAQKFPRNVNTMVTAALLSTGPDECEGVLIADPDLNCAVAEVEAWSTDGSYFRTEKRQPAQGVSGTEMLDSAWYSLKRALNISEECWRVV
ncbi:MAG: DUF108 domain-containing protein [Aestuariivita sp.]|nr:DUF108 domain-containing protein [Aestuariivita sp.]